MIAERAASGSVLLAGAFRGPSRDFQSTGTVIAQAAVGDGKRSTIHAASRTTEGLV
jgi:hypothetical protein